MDEIVFYCTWGVTKIGGNYYLPDVHAVYLKEAEKHYKKIVLITTETNDASLCTSVVPDAYDIYVLPKLSSYARALSQIFKYYVVFKEVTNRYRSATYYLRIPQPFSWLFQLLKCKSSKLVYHLMSNPVEAIMKKESERYIVRCLKVSLFLPDFMLTMVAARLNYCSCNGETLKKQLKYWLSSSTVVLNESTLYSSDFLPEEKIKQRNESEPLKLIYVGYLRSAKGTRYLLSAINDLASQGYNIKLTMVGSGEMYNFCNDFIFKNGLTKNIELTGHISERDHLLELYSQNDVFVFPSLSEGSPRVVIEAMSRGLAVIATNVGNTKVLIKKNGLLVEPRSSESLVESIIFYFDDENKRYLDARQLLKDSKKYTLENFFLEFSSIGINDA
ncbi:glycosyltransferase [Vibrio breoganii]